MSKTIKILQNSVEKTVKKVAKIKTQLANGRQCYWVPEEDYPLGVLNVTEDGEYIASSDPNGPFYGYSEIHVEGVGTTEMGALGTITITANGTYEADKDSQGPFYGYSTVIVNVSDEDAQPDHISGKDPDGNDEVVKVDDDGNLVTETIPSSIKIISPPDILTYYDGELIDFHGIYVKGYLADGTEWGVVPNDELSFPEPIAEWDEEGVSLDFGPVNLPIPFSSTGTATNGRTTWELGFTDGDGKLTNIMKNSSYTIHLFASESSSTVAVGVKGGSTTRWSLTSSFTHNNKTVYYRAFTGSAWTGTPVCEPVANGGEYINMDLTDSVAGSISWWIVYGGGAGGSTQTIPVQWHRPGDGKSLYDSFEITVINADNSGSGQDPQPAPTPSPD